MTYTLADLMPLYFGLLPSQLLNDKGKQVIQNVSGYFPVLSGVGLEYHFNSKDSRTDFLIRITREEARSPYMRWQEYFAGLGQYGKHIEQPSLFASEGIENLWYEFDLKDTHDDRLIPSLFFDLDRENAMDPLVKIHTLDRLLIGCFDREIHSSLAFLTSLLADRQAQLYYVGLMLSREKSPVRICLLFNNPPYLLTFLQQRIPGGYFLAAAELLAKIIGMTSRVVLDLNLTEHPYDELGVELFFDTPHQLQDCMEMLTNRGIISQYEQDTFLLCQKTISCDAISFPQIGYFRTGINHIKVSFNKGILSSVKGYVYLSYY